MRTVRRGVFETNSSSTHSITMCSDEEYKKWSSGELYLSNGEFITKDEAIERLKDSGYYKDLDFNDEEAVAEAMREEYILTEEQYDNKNDMETFYDTYTTKSGEKVVAFGYYGYDS